MTIFRYRARDKTTKRAVSGTLEAVNSTRAIKELRARNLLILDVRPNGSKFSFNFSWLIRVSPRDRVLFARQFAVMMRAGLPIVSALTAIEEQTANASLTRAIGVIRHDVEGGTALSTAFNKHPNAFPPIFSSVAKIGEKSGKLEQVLERLASQLEKDSEMTGKVKSAMVYPGFVFIALIAVVILLMVFIVPQLNDLFADAEMELPLITKSLLVVGKGMRDYLPIWGTLAALSIVGFLAAYHKMSGVRYFVEQVSFRTPVINKLTKNVIMARFTHMLSTLLNAGLPMIEALQTVNTTLQSPSYDPILRIIAKQVEGGQALSQTILISNQFPPMIGHMIAVGEKSGTIDEMLESISGYYDQEIEGLTRNLSAMLEPILMVLMGLGVGLVVASVIVPIYNLVSAV